MYEAHLRVSKTVDTRDNSRRQQPDVRKRQMQDGKPYLGFRGSLVISFCHLGSKNVLRRLNRRACLPNEYGEGSWDQDHLEGMDLDGFDMVTQKLKNYIAV